MQYQTTGEEKKKESENNIDSAAHNQTYDHPKLNQEDINHLNTSITQNGIEAVIKRFQKKKSTGPDVFLAEFYQYFKEKLIPNLLKLFQQREKKGTLPNSLHEVSIILIPKADKETSNYRPIFLMNSNAKILKKIMAN
jgi:hypothetical protein